MKIEFKQTGGQYGDATSSYDVIVPEGTTVGDFVRYIAYDYSLKKGEWGEISMFYNDKSSFADQVRLVSYKRGFANYAPGCNHDIFARLAGKVITKVRANGGWSCMGYDVYVD